MSQQQETNYNAKHADQRLFLGRALAPTAARPRKAAACQCKRLSAPIVTRSKTPSGAIRPRDPVVPRDDDAWKTSCVSVKLSLMRPRTMHARELGPSILPLSLALIASACGGGDSTRGESDGTSGSGGSSTDNESGGRGNGEASGGDASGGEASGGGGLGGEASGGGGLGGSGAAGQDACSPTCDDGFECVAGECTCPHTACGDVCIDTEENPRACGGCETVCESTEGCSDGSCCAAVPQPLDVLFVVDNTNSMVEEQAALTADLASFLSKLVTGDSDDDGTADVVAADLHVGVITTDMGSGGFIVPTCSAPTFGDDGVLRTEGNPNIQNCAATYPAVHSIQAGDDLNQAAFELSCVTSAGTAGCGFEQPLEAALKALTPSTSPLRFVQESTGHADGANSGFLRDAAMLAVVILSDDNDCSSADPELFDPGSETYDAELGLRCFEHPEALHPVRRYVDGLVAAKGDPKRLVVATLGGVPTDLVGENLQTILDDSRMVERKSEELPRLEASCEGDLGMAFPPRRTLETALELEPAGVRIVTGSVCSASFASFFDQVAERVAAELPRVCE